MVNEEYSNGIDWATVAVGLAGFLACLVIGVALNDVSALVLGLVLGSGFLTATLYKEFLHRPTLIRIEPGGFRMHWRGGRSRFFRWDRVKWIYMNPGKPDHPIKKHDRFGALKLDHVFPYALTYDLAQAIIQGCYEETGRFPPSYRNARR